jgi:ectoine hydroxylase-related dioxygenase (phytanoyl-CoA dioxygenase family)
MATATTEENALELETLGYTSLEACIDAKYPEDTRKELLAEYESALPMPWRGGGKWFGHLSYVPSPASQIIREVASNARIKGVLDRALGKDYKIVGFGGNANLPGSKYQPAHMDGWLGTDFVVVNIPLGKTTEQNGSTEVWPRTHHEKMTVAQFNAKPRESVRLNASAGDIILRWSNLWHRGTPNKSPDVRIMLALLVSPVYGKLPPVTVSEEDHAEFASFGLPVNAKTGAQSKKGFGTSYFPATLKGNIFELTWMYAPPVFTAIRRFKKSSI